MKQAVWFEQFADEFRALAFDPIGSEWLVELAAAVYPFASKMGPAQAAKPVNTSRWTFAWNSPDVWCDALFSIA